MTGIEHSNLIPVTQVVGEKIRPLQAFVQSSEVRHARSSSIVLPVSVANRGRIAGQRLPPRSCAD